MNYSHTDTDLPIENQYPKLIRDKIPELIESQGKQARTKVPSNDEEYLEFLFLKLIEEATELSRAGKDEHQAEELADVLKC